MKTIYKYPIRPELLFELELPADAKILSVGVQDNSPVFWAEVDTDRPARVEYFMTIGTGQYFPLVVRSAIHLGTFQLPPFVWHLYKVVLK